MSLLLKINCIVYASIYVGIMSHSESDAFDLRSNKVHTVWNQCTRDLKCQLKPTTSCFILFIAYLSLFMKPHMLMNNALETSYVDEPCSINLICYLIPFISCLILFIAYLSLFICYLSQFIAYLTGFISFLSLFIS